MQVNEFTLPVFCLYLFQMFDMACMMSNAAKQNIVIFQIDQICHKIAQNLYINEQMVKVMETDGKKT